ncbi:hypothetical protein A4A49_08144 [Nicotiana attenuata]|uniref:Spt20-like SEP domain-containing protein n=1 Tax=Nicotiana attenuata TaxID=49451 RepID=A0A1J6HWC5_NICAT|nr:hypothetical protein A4A49_08144 [Nicotiana attenuata]
MGISFKVSKTGTRFRPKPIRSKSETSTTTAGKDNAVAVEVTDTKGRTYSLVPQTEFDSPSAAKITEVMGLSCGNNLLQELSAPGCLLCCSNESGHQTSEVVPKFLHPYDSASETLFSAIESGRLPGDILEDIPCKYVGGTLVCEVWDYRKCFAKAGQSVPSATGSPFISRLCLKLSLKNVVKDIPLISDNAWTYGDLMEVESGILRALEPQLCLDPTPKLDRLWNNPVSSKLSLGLGNIFRKRLRGTPEVTVTSNSRIHGKNVCIDRVTESSKSGPLVQQPLHDNLNAQDNVPTDMLTLKGDSFVSKASVPASPLVSHLSKYQMGVQSPRRIMQDHKPDIVLNASVSFPAAPDRMLSYTNQ